MLLPLLLLLTLLLLFVLLSLTLTPRLSETGWVDVLRDDVRGTNSPSKPLTTDLKTKVG